MVSVETTKEPSSLQTRFYEWFGGEDSTGFILKMLSPALFVFTIGILFPLVYGVWVSFFSYENTTNSSFVGIGNYFFLFGQEAFWNSYWNTVFFTLITVILETFLGLGIALILNKKFTGRGIVRAAILVPWAVPTIVNARIWEYVFGGTVRSPVNDVLVNTGIVSSPLIFTAGRDMPINVIQILMTITFYFAAVATIYTVYVKLADPRNDIQEVSRKDAILYGTFVVTLIFVLLPKSAYFGGALSFASANVARDWVTVIVVDVWKTTPFMALLILAGLQVIPQDLMKAAEVDGANSWQKFRNVTFPLLLPSLGIALLFRLIDAFRVYDIFAIFSAERIESITKYAVRKHSAQKFGQSSAIALFEFINIIVMTVIVMKVTRRRTDI